MAIEDYGWFSHVGGEEPSVSKSNQDNNHFNLWKFKPLHGQVLRDVEGETDTALQWSWLASASLMLETEGFILQHRIRLLPQCT